MSVASYIARVMGSTNSNLIEGFMTKFNNRISQPISAEDARPNGVSLCHAFNPKGGVTIAYRKQNEYKNCRMVEVAVTYCSPADTFSKKIGSTRATQNFLDGATVLVPLRDPVSPEELVERLRWMFWYSLEISKM